MASWMGYLYHICATKSMLRIECRIGSLLMVGGGEFVEIMGSAHGGKDIGAMWWNKLEKILLVARLG